MKAALIGPRFQREIAQQEIDEMFENLKKDNTEEQRSTILRVA